MNNQTASAIGGALVHVQDASDEIREGTRWAVAIFRAIQHAPSGTDDAKDLASIGQYLVERSEGISSADLERLKADLTTLQGGAA